MEQCSAVFWARTGSHSERFQPFMYCSNILHGACPNVVGNKSLALGIVAIARYSVTKFEGC